MPARGARSGRLSSPEGALARPPAHLPEALERNGHERTEWHQPEAAGALLLVEDDESVRVTLQTILEAEGYDVTPATGVPEAVQLFGAHGFDAVLTDLRIGTASGLAVLEEAHRVAPETPVVVLTGYGSMEGAIEALRRGAFDFLLKPTDLDQLKAVVARAVQGVRLTRQLRLEAQARERAEARAAIAGAERDRMAALAEASRIFAESALDVPALLDTVARQVSASVGDGVTLFLLSEDGAWLELAAAYHPDPERLAFQLQLPGTQRIPVGEGVNGRVAQSGQPVLVADISLDALRAAAAPAYRPILERYPIHSLLSVPLRARGRVIGTLAASRDTADAPYGAEDQQFLEALADRAAQAVENARLYEREQAARAQAEAAVRVRDDFFSLASHELKTPMTALRGFAQLELRRIRRRGELDEARVVHAFQTIVSQTDRLNRLVTEMLDVSRIQTGKLRLDPSDTDLSALVERAAGEFRLAEPEREVRVAAPETLRATVDPVRVQQVLLNLLDNAAKFSPDSAPIEVGLALAEPSDAASHAMLSVRDWGVGIPEGDRERIFERSYQVRPENAGSGTGGSLAGTHRGMGLGLYISRQIVQLHGGEIRVEAPPDGGTRFVVRLPLAPA